MVYVRQTGAYILFSYGTPVATKCTTDAKWMKPKTGYSNTTSRHISTYAEGAVTISDTDFSSLLKEAFKSASTEKQG